MVRKGEKRGSQSKAQEKKKKKKKTKQKKRFFGHATITKSHFRDFTVAKKNATLSTVGEQMVRLTVS
jgi:hypothetical protein